MRATNLINTLLLVIGTTFPCWSHSQDPSEGKLRELRDQFEELRDDLSSPRVEFVQRYSQELSKLKAKATSDANLELVLAIQKEEKLFKTRAAVGDSPSPLPELARLQQIYDREMPRLEAQETRQFVNLVSGYQKQLNELKQELTKAGSIYEAVTVETEIKRVRSLRPDLSSEPVSPSESGKTKKGRFVRVLLEGSERLLSLAEVQVFSGGKNVATEGKASQSSTHAEGGPPELAIDGNTEGRFFAGRSASNTAKEDDPWWEVDLGSEVEISKIVIWNRTDQNLQDRLNGFKLIVLDARRTKAFEKTFPTAPQLNVEVEVSDE